MRFTHQPNSLRSSPREATRRPHGIFAMMAGLWVIAGHVVAQDHVRPVEDYDRRLEMSVPTKYVQSASQRNAIAAWRAALPDVRVDVDTRTGATRSISNAMGTLTRSAAPGFDPETVAREFLGQNLEALGLQSGDLEEMVLRDHVKKSLTGADHFYFQQIHFGIPASGAQLQVHVGADGSVQGVNNGFLPNLQGSVNALAPSREAKDAVANGLDHLGMATKWTDELETNLSDRRRASRIGVAGVANGAVDATLMWLPVAAGDARLVWSFTIDPEGDSSIYDLNVDAISGEVWTRFNRTSAAVHRAFLLPRETPYTSTGGIPVDGRGSLFSIGGPRAGWHEDGNGTYTTHRGNNVHAFADPLGYGFPTGSQPDCGVNISCNFPLDFRKDIRTYKDASITNLFYLVNMVHDIQYQYGFDEQAGNFQDDNFGRGGRENDAVRAITQGPDLGYGPEWVPTRDGVSPKLMMPLLRFDGPPTRDTAWDNLMVVHEYGHGVSTRLVGGPDNVGCLIRPQSRGLGEGWSDFLGLWYTAEASDRGTDGRGVGQWMMGEAASHRGLRPKRYSTNGAINNYTYQSITQDTATHSVGAVWAQALWEVYWALVDKYGFNARLKDAWRLNGNQRAMRYITDGMQRTGCHPSFLDARDAIIAAVGAYRGGEDRCLVWEAFAEFGLGTNAQSNGATTFAGVANGFQVPSGCCGVSTPLYIDSHGPGQLCQDNSVQFFTNPDSMVDTYRWELLNASGSVVRSSTTTVPRFYLSGWGLSAGNHVLRVRANRACGGVSSWRSQAVVVRPPGSLGCGCNPLFQICGPR